MSDKQIFGSIVGAGIVGDVFFIEIKRKDDGEIVSVEVDAETFRKITNCRRGEVKPNALRKTLDRWGDSIQAFPIKSGGK